MSRLESLLDDSASTITEVFRKKHLGSNNRIMHASTTIPACCLGLWLQNSTPIIMIY